MHVTSTLAEPSVETSTEMNTVDVLYVEDHPVNVLVMESLLAYRPKVAMRVAPTVETGYQMAVSQRPDLLLIDLMLPDGTGVELLQRLRQHPRLQDVPAILVTAGALGGVDVSGFQEVWPKPLNVAHVLGRMDQMFNLPQHQGG